MPSYVRAGKLPPKRHIQFRRPDGGLYAEELFSTKGFESVYSLLLSPAAADGDARSAPMETAARFVCAERAAAQPPLQNRAEPQNAMRSNRARRCSATATF